jgi:hypothetical protein
MPTMTALERRGARFLLTLAAVAVAALILALMQ